MKTIRTITATAAATLAVLSLSSCSSKTGSPVSVPESRPDMTMSETTSSPVDTVRPGTRVAIGDGDERVICTMGFVLTDNVKWFATTASYCVSKGELPVYVQNTSGEMVKIGVAQSNYNGSYDRQGNNVGLIEIDRAALKKAGISAVGSIVSDPPLNPFGTMSPKDWFESAKKVMDGGDTVKVCWWTNNSVRGVVQRCGTPKFGEGDKIGVTPDPSSDPNVDPFESSAAGAPATWTAGDKDKKLYPLGTVTDYHTGTILIDSIVVQTGIKNNTGGTWRIVGS